MKNKSVLFVTSNTKHQSRTFIYAQIRPKHRKYSRGPVILRPRNVYVIKVMILFTWDRTWEGLSGKQVLVKVGRGAIGPSTHP